MLLRSSETLPARCECTGSSFRVVVEVVILNVFDSCIAVVADSRYGYSSFKCEGDPGMTERVPGQNLP